MHVGWVSGAPYAYSLLTYGVKQGNGEYKDAAINVLDKLQIRRDIHRFLRCYDLYAQEGQSLDAFVEVTLKYADRQDPPISKSALEMLGLLSADEYNTLEKLTKQVSQVVKDELSDKGIELYDIKLEFGRVKKDNQVVLIDEISGGNMRAYKNGVYIEPLLEKLMLAD
ncbi:Phosphoribosylaminoimidazole-succinocarboxamide synthase [compost metagenome]